jgi:CRISPR-associated endonuclease Cas2
MRRKGWYILAYDIANPKRLVKIHRFIKHRGIAIQKSVFLIQGTEPQLVCLLDRIVKLMDIKCDDLRAYPIFHPRKIWANNPEQLSFYFNTSPIFFNKKSFDNSFVQIFFNKLKTFLKGIQ